MNDDTTTDNPADPRNFAHHYVTVKKSSQRTSSRTFHTEKTCQQLVRISPDCEVQDLPVEVVLYLNLDPCVSCGPKEDKPDPLLSVMSDAITRIRQNPHVRPSSDEIALLVREQMLFKGLRITRMPSSAKRPATDPIDAWLDETTPQGAAPVDEPVDELEGEPEDEPAGEPEPEERFVPLGNEAECRYCGATVTWKTGLIGDKAESIPTDGAGQICCDSCYNESTGLGEPPTTPEEPEPTPAPLPKAAGPVAGEQRTGNNPDIHVHDPVGPPPF